MRHEIDLDVCANRCAAVTLACVVTMNPRQPSWQRPRRCFVVCALVRFAVRAAILPPEPSGDAKERQTDGATPDGPPLSAATGVRKKHFAIRTKRFRAWHFGRSRPFLWSIGSIRNWYPAGDEREGLGRTRRALLRVVNLVAVQAEAGGPQLHGCKCTKESGSGARDPGLGRYNSGGSEEQDPSKTRPTTGDYPALCNGLSCDLEEPGGAAIEVGQPGIVEAEPRADRILTSLASSVGQPKP